MADVGRHHPATPGPCEAGLQGCIATAQQTYSMSISTCFEAGGIVAGFSKWFGLAAGFACFVFANNAHNNAKEPCIYGYVNCRSSESRSTVQNENLAVNLKP